MANSLRLKSFLSLLLALAMVLSMAACGGKPGPEPSSSDPDSQLSGGGDLSDGSGDPDSSSQDEVDSSGSDSPADTRTPKEIFNDLAKKTVTSHEKNRDTMGWLYVPGTTIDESVVQGFDNDYYLRRDFLGRNAFDGSYFLDYRTRLGERAQLSPNVVIYGHSMDDNPDGARFSQLKKYLDVEYAKQNPYIYFTTPDSDNMIWQIFAVFYTDISFEYHHPNMDNAQFLSLINEARQRSQLNFDLPVGVNDTILTLSTCTYLFDPAKRANYRFVVMAKLLPAGAEAKTPVKVEVNPTPKAPSA